MKSLKIELNAPVTITFTILSFLLVLAGYATRGDSIGLLACQRTDLKDPMQYVRLFSDACDSSSGRGRLHRRYMCFHL